MENRWLQSLNGLPGPLWIFGAYGCHRAGDWLVSQFFATWSWEWLSMLMSVQVFVASLLPLLLFVLVVMRKSYAVPLVGWYAVGRALACVVGLLGPLLNNPVPEFMTLAEQGALLSRLVGWGVAWTALFLYVERSVILVRVFPLEGRRTLWWAVVLLILFCPVGG